jgi:ribosomal protein L7/L12
MLSRTTIPTAKQDFSNAMSFVQNFRDHGMGGIGRGTHTDTRDLFNYAVAMQDELAQTWSLINAAVKCGLINENDGVLTLAGVSLSAPMAPGPVPALGGAFGATGPLPGLDRLTEADKIEIRRLVGNDRLIEALKYCREKTGLGLKEAKDYVESLREPKKPVVPMDGERVVTIPDTRGFVTREEFNEVKTQLSVLISGLDNLTVQVTEKLKADRYGTPSGGETLSESAEKAVKEATKPGGSIVEIKSKSEVEKPGTDKPLVASTPADDSWIDTVKAFQLLGGKGVSDGSTVVDTTTGKNIVYKTFRQKDNSWFVKMGFKVDPTKRAAGQKGWLLPVAK